jgi:protein-S-isoprenylcysteine O-methyltransferase Ste14
MRFMLMESDKSSVRFIMDRVQRNILSLAALGVAFFVLAGRIDIWGFWIYIAVVILYQVISLSIIVPNYPAYSDLAEARKVRHSDVKAWDKVLVLVMTISTFLMYGLAALDLGRFQLGVLSIVWAVPGVVLYVIGSMLNQWAMLSNPHFERGVRIQEERGHRVAVSGPYQIVRHPGYLGSVLFFIAFPLIIGSAVSWIGATIGIIGMLVRTYLEDDTLREELAGYEEYVRVVKYRLIPYMW